jgi:hypothetical protein
MGVDLFPALSAVARPAPMADKIPATPDPLLNLWIAIKIRFHVSSVVKLIRELFPLSLLFLCDSE